MNLIVAVDQNWAIGNQGDQLVYLKKDLEMFRHITEGHPVILGRKTLATFPGGKPLKNRRNLILSSTPGFQVEGAEVFSSLEDLLKIAPTDSFVIGGASVYRALLDYCTYAYVTKIHASFPADTWFPCLDDRLDWTEILESGDIKEGELDYHFSAYMRCQKASDEK